jgi:hypothetical protein
MSSSLPSNVEPSALIRIKRELQAGKFESLSSFLRNITDQGSLIAVREQKLLLKIADATCRSSIAHIYKEAASRIFSHDSSEFLEEANYADFAVLISDKRDQVAARAATYLKELPRVSLLELLNVIIEQSFSWYDQISESGWKRVSGALSDYRESPLTRAAVSERALHEVVGATNDLVFAVARALGHALNYIDKKKTFTSGRAVRRGTSEAFARIVEVSAEWNGLEYLADQVSYGEWVVRSIQLSEPVQVIFGMRDERLAFARMLGIRRQAVALFEGTERLSALRLQLEAVLPDFLDRCLSRLGSGVIRQLPVEGTISLKAALKRRLAELEPSDDLLMAAGGPERSIVDDYIAALSIRWFGDVALFVAQHVSKRAKRAFIPPVATAEEIGSFLPLEAKQRMRVISAIGRLVERRNGSRHLSFLASPFLELADQRIAYVPTLDAGRWPTDLRAKWLREGDVAHKFGKLWEEFVLMVFRDFHWKVLGRGIKLRQNGKTVGDIDLIVQRDELVLILQLKALAGQGVSPYDHWRNRKTIEKGASQAAIALEFIRHRPHFLQGVASRQAVANVRRVEGAVLTNLHLFNGWLIGSVPVLSRNGLMTILNGATVKFHRAGDTRVVAVEQVEPMDKWECARFIQLLLNPVDWRISQERSETSHHCVESEQVRWQIPMVGNWSMEPLKLEDHVD